MSNLNLLLLLRKRRFNKIIIRAPSLPVNITWDHPQLSRLTKYKEADFPKTHNESDGKPIVHLKE